MIIKKSFLVGSIICTLAGVGVQPLINPAFAQTTQSNTQLENQLSPSLQPKSQVKLITPGVQPRQILRFTPQAGSKQTADMQMDMDMSMSMNGNPVPKFQMPGTSLKFNTVVNKVEPNGDIYYEFSYPNVDLVGQSNLPPSALQGMRREMKKIQGFKGNAIVDNMGRTKKADFVVPVNLNPALKQILDQMKSSITELSAPIPKQAIGKGAKWQVTSQMKFNGINLQQTANYELVDIKDGIATMNISLTQQAAGIQKMVLPQMPKGTTMTLQSYNATGGGQAKISLNRIMPLSTSIKTNTNAKMLVIEANSQEKTILDQQILMQMNIKSN
ncbi:MAG: hypothetical protein ACFB2X_07375 [Rivularia sp. (in: cyanobacteria)]